MDISTERFWIVSLIAGVVVFGLCIAIEFVHWSSVLAGLVFGAGGLIVDRNLKKPGFSASGWALTLGGGVLIAINGFKPIVPDSEQVSWIVLLEYVAMVWTTWGIFLFLFPFKPERR